MFSSSVVLKGEERGHKVLSKAIKFQPKPTSNYFPRLSALAFSFNVSCTVFLFYNRITSFWDHVWQRVFWVQKKFF